MEVQHEVKLLESKLMSEVHTLSSDIARLTVQITLLVTHQEFKPVKMLTYGYAGGVLSMALTTMMARILGWF